MGLFDFKRKKSQSSKASAYAVQTSESSHHPYNGLSSYTPLNYESRTYAQLRDAIPILDAAINKIIRLTEGFSFETGNERINQEINRYFENINVGGNQRGISAFVSNYLNQLLTYGTAVGEIVLDEQGIYALYNSELSCIELKRAANGIDVEFYNYNNKIAAPELILYSVLDPLPGSLTGTSLLRGLPFVSDILMKIFNAVGQNWEHAGNVRYAVTCKSDGNGINDAEYKAQSIAEAWRDAMDSSSVKDFVAVGDVSVKVIGADNAVMESEVPVKQMLEQIVAKTGIPPFMLGLSWSSTERMSTQQADILTTELDAYRRILTPVITKIGNLYLALNGYDREVEVVWDDITLQDKVDDAKAELYYAQAEKIRRESE